jgi:hypothetical protein
MSRHHFVTASALMALAVLVATAPAMAQTGGGSRGTGTGTGTSGTGTRTTGTTTSGGGTKGTAPSRNTLPSSALTTSSVASPFAWLDDGRILPPAVVTVAVSTLHWQGTGVSEVDVPVTSIAAGVAPRVQLGASIPHIVGSADPAGAVGGLGDLYFYGKVGLLPDSSPIKLAVAPTIEVLSDGVAQTLAAGESRTQFGLPVSVEFDTGPARLYAGTGFFTRGIRFAGGGASFRATSKLGVSLSLSHSWTTSDTLGVVADRTEVTGSASYSLVNSIAIFGSIGQTIATTDANGAGTTVSGGISVLLTPSLFKRN